jgi:adenosylhomocysteine nucleosidase
MKRIGIIAALRGELKPLVRGWQQRGKLYTGKLREVECIAIAGGMGAEAATRATELVLAEGAIDALVSYGWCGALSCGLKPPAACAISEIVDSKTGNTFATSFSSGQRLLTLDHVARPDEKRGLAEKYRTPLVDMEAAAVARIAAAHNLPFYCLKGISDGYTDDLPDFNRFLGKDGQLQMPAFVAYALLHPKYWSALVQMGKQSQAAARNLADLAADSLGRTR